MFKPAPKNVQFPQLEEATLAFWKENKIYEKSLQQRSGAPRFVFYEGPPTANGMPHPGHCLTRAIKDLFPRYRTMRGYYCERKAGWDTHGLPVEVEVCKEMGIHSKEEIEAFGIEPFIHKCQASVWRYMREWERLTDRLGFWIHLDEAYVTYHQSYVESVWWSLKNFFDRGLLYKGHKIVWWWAQGGTALSAGEVGQGYREVADPSVFVRFPLIDEPETSLLVWTTTPWTLPSNQFAAVHPELTYAKVLDAESGERFLLAEALVDSVAVKAKREWQVESTCKGAELLGLRYTPPFSYYHDKLGNKTGVLVAGGQQHVAWRVVAADFVTTESGTGVVHQAPAFGEVDFDVLKAEQSRFAAGQGPELICAVAPDGKFTAEAPGYEGRWVKEADKDINRELRERGVLFHLEQYLHEYPFCWRAEEDPLIQYPRESWFIRTTQFREQMLANNQQINWLPAHIKDGRFGNFLEANVDWSLSRERFWGTPLPIWVCEKTGQKEAIANYADLLAKPGAKGMDVWEKAKAEKPELPDDLKVHKPYIDAITYDSPFQKGARMRRVTEVIDCWYDSGAMPFAQWGYPQQGREEFAAQFPADFISEALDQTRGWFYSQLAISTMLFGDDTTPRANAAADTNTAADASTSAEITPRPFPHPFRNCIVLGLMMGEDGKKMSKSKGNYRQPQEIFDVYGADAMRWFFFANQAPWSSINYSEKAIKESIPEFLLRLWNVYSFFVIYAQIDGFEPEKMLAGEVGSLDAAMLARAGGSYRPVKERGELDRWVLSELHRTCREVVAGMDAYDNYAAATSLTKFLDGLSNWYVRRSRDRFWGGDKASPEKTDAYWTLYECLLTLSKLIAPFTPFLAEELWRNLTDVFDKRAAQSVHLCDFPEGDADIVDETLSSRMELLREITSLGRSARMDAKLKVRQPLQKVEVILADDQSQRWLESHDALVRDELNVKSVEYTTEADQYISFQVQPNFKRLGPRVGKLIPVLKKTLAEIDGGALLRQLKSDGQATIALGDQTIVLDEQDIQVRLKAKPGWAAAQGARCVVVLSTELTDALIGEGWANDLIRFIQERRKELDCQYTDRIHVGLKTDSAELLAAVANNQDRIQQETLATELHAGASDAGWSSRLNASDSGAAIAIGGHALTLHVCVAESGKE